MQTILNTALPFFALIFCGYGAGRFKLLSEASIAGVNAFVFYFALPAFIFNLLATSPLADVVNGPFVAAYLGTGLVVFAVAAVLGRLIFEVRRSEAALQGAAAVLGNTGYMGIPLVAAAFGDRAAIPLVLGLTLEATVLIPLTIVLVEAQKGLDAGWSRLLGSVAGAMVRNPIIIAIFTGVAVSAASLGLPTPIENFTDLLGRAAGPCALFALGATLTSFPISTGIGEVSYMTFFKLLVHPAAIWFATTRLFDVDPLWASVAILGASLPVAANVFIEARQYDTYVDRTSSAILISTAISVFTVSALLTVLPLD
ncbi:MAG TPA: AEC family transporter [Rubrobacteraceae bacterium]|nr:AEC family transporter [Rubrobacteraceae bacterium]